MAKAWQLTPRQWRECSVEDQAQMMALLNFEATREAYRSEERERLRKEAARGHTKNDYELQKEQIEAMKARAQL